MKTITLPYPVSANRYWRKTNTGRTYISSDAIAYRAIVASVCKKDGIIKSASKVLLKVTLHPRLTKKGYSNAVVIDLDNALKVTLDALQGHAYKDDKQVCQIYLEYGEPVANGGLTVTIDDYREVKNGG